MADKGDVRAQAQQPGAKTPNPHVIILSFPAQGHIIPAIRLAHKLASDGFTITFMCADHRISKIKKNRGTELSPRIRLIGLADGVAPEDQQSIDQGVDNFVQTIQTSQNMAAAFEHAISKLIEEDISKEGARVAVTPPLLIIGDFFASWYLDVARKFQIPSYTFCTSPCIALAVMLYLPRLMEEGIAPVAAEARKIVVPGLPQLCSSELPVDWQQSAAKEWRDYTFRTLLRLHEASGILVNSFYELESKLIDAATFNIVLNPYKVPIYPIGPILPSGFFRGEIHDAREIAFSDEDIEHCMSWLDRQTPSSVLYVSFGSVAIPSIRQIQKLAKGLDNSHQAFLWSFRLPPPSAATEGGGALEFPDGFLSGSHSRGLIVSTWATQLLILSHASTGGFLTHSGWNSILESICSGVPMLSLPQFAEQCLNSKLVTDILNVGVKLDRGADGVVDSRAIEIAVRELMQGQEGVAMRRRAAALKDKAANAVAYGGSSYNTLQRFFHSGMNTHSK